MIQLRKNPFSDDTIDIPFVEGETAKELVDRALAANGYELSENILFHFHVVINGKIIERDMWPFCKIVDSDTVLVCPRIARGSGGQMFKMVALIVIAVAAAAVGQGYVTAGALTAMEAGMIVAAVTIGATLALNALIPPPGLPGLGGLGGVGTSFEGSQMYTITSQSNNAKKFGSVPRVYGIHRIFPIIAANPYTEILADPVNGNLVQYFYCIYDFGFGPLDIHDIRIGETPIGTYADSHWRLVDPNKPAVSEGPWDDVLYKDFSFYKGDIERDGTQIVLDRNQNSSGAQLFEYQAVRNASSKVNGSKQEIILDFICPQGLQGIASNGNKTNRNIDILIEFSKVGEDVWRPYNDSAYVDDYHAAGGSVIFQDRTASVPVIDSVGQGGDYTLLSKQQDHFYWFWNNTTIDGVSTVGYTDHDNNPATLRIKMVSSEIRNYGYPAGTTKIALANVSIDITNGDQLYFKGNRLGTVVSTSAAPWPGYTYYHLDAPTTNSHVLFTMRFRYAESLDDSNAKFPVYTKFLYDGQWLASSSVSDKIYVKTKTLGVARISGNTQNPHYSSFTFKPKQIAQYKIRITRQNTFSSISNYTYQTIDKLTLVNLATRFDRNPILSDKRHVFLEVKVRATNQLTGAINNLSAIAESVLDVYDPDTATWSKQKTNNPAWVFCDLLTGTVNKRAITKDRLHLPSIVEWADFCDEIPTPPPTQSFTQKRFSTNFVLDFDTTLQALINTMANGAQASLNIIDGKYGVLIDRMKTTPVQIFTPRNSSGFTSTRTYDRSFHALKIRYIDPFKNWDIAEIMFYDQGYDEDTATEFDELSTFACTNYEQAWRFGRYMLAQARLRKERISIQVDFEHIVCTRGDYVQVTQDVMRVGGRPARVKEITGPDTVKIDDGIDTLNGVDYGYTYRSVTDGIKTSTCDVIDSDEFKLYGDMPAVGDLIIIGEVGKIAFDCLVKSITPGSDMTATIELVEKADDIYLAESSDILPDYDPKLTQNVDSANAIPPEVENLEVVANSWRVIGGAYEYFIDIDWDIPTGAAVETYEIYVDNGSGYDLVDFTQKSFYEHIVDPNFLNIEHWFKVIGVSSTGKKIPLIEAPAVSATPLKKVTPPSNVEYLAINITDQVIQLDWKKVTDADLFEYILRYSPVTDGATWEASIPLMRADKNTTLASTQGRTGTYFIKAIDLNANESSVSAIAITSIPNLFDLNIIEETNDFPALEGELVTCETDTVGLTLKRLVAGGFETNQYYPDGYYYYKNFLDLGEIYTVRLQSLIEAEGFTVGDLMSNWPDLASLTAMSMAGQSTWDVETQYRTTDSFNVMSEWSALSLVTPLSEGQQDNWTIWKKFIMGDATGRIFQFRLKLISNAAYATPRVYDGVIRADMPDRSESYNNLVAPPEGLEIVYSPAFKGPGSSPNIQITQDDAETGDYYKIENKTLNGFKITFYDKNDVAVTRQFDAAIKGYGRKALTVI